MILGLSVPFLCREGTRLPAALSLFTEAGTRRKKQIDPLPVQRVPDVLFIRQ